MTVPSRALLLAALLAAAPLAAAAPPPGEVTRPAMALSATPDPRSPTGVAIPADLASAIDQLDRMVPSGWKERFRALPEEGHASAQADLGRWVTANWGLFQESALARWFQNAGVYPPDDMAGVLLLGLWRKLNGLPLEQDLLLSRYGVATLDASSLEEVELGQGKKKEPARRFTGRRFRVDLPPAGRVRVADREAKSGYTMASFYGAGERQLLAVYAGGHPSYPAMVPPRVRIRKGVFGGRPAEWSEWKFEGRYFREIKVEMPAGGPEWLHLWYRGLTPGEKKEADRLIARLVPLGAAP